MAESLALFHFIRPWWLAALPMILLLWWLTRRITMTPPPWQQHIAPHLLKALLVNQQTSRHLYVIDITAAILVCLSLAAAGPTWSRVPNPFFSETAPLVIALNVDESMLTNDVQPNRLERAKLKVLDLIELRSGARTGLIAYAGTAHMVLPLTEDPDLMKPFLEGLAPDIMPAAGHDAAAVLALAEDLLVAESTPGSVLFVTDAIESDSIPEFATYKNEANSPPLAALIIGTEAGGTIRLDDGRIKDGPGVNWSQIDRWRDAGEVSVVRFTADDADTRKVEKIVASNLQATLDQDDRSQWKDQGWWLLWPAVILALFSFRRGWTMAWDV